MTGPEHTPEPIPRTSPAAAPATRGWLLFFAAILVATTLNSLLEQQGALAVVLTMAAVGVVFLFGRSTEAVVVLLFVFLAGTVAYGAAQLFGILSQPNHAGFGRAAAGACGAAVLLAVHFSVRRGKGEVAAPPSQTSESRMQQKTTAYDLMLRTVTRIPTYVRRFRPAGRAR